MITQEPRLSAIESRLSRLEGLFEQMNERIASIERRLERLESKVDRQFLWLVGITVTSWLTLLIAIVVKKGG